MVNVLSLSGLGALEIGTVISVFLFGATSLQVYIYHSRFPDDQWQLRVLVTTLWLLELGHAISILYAFYTISVLQSGHSEKALDRSLAGISATVFLSGCITFSVQTFFANRVRQLTAMLYITIFCWFLSFLRFVANTGMVIVLASSGLDRFFQNWKWLFSVNSAIGTFVDILIAASLCYNLVERRKSPFQSTTLMLNRLIVTTIQTGLVTSLMTLAMTICFLTMAENLIWIAMFLCLASVFSNSLLASFNSRTAPCHHNNTIHPIPLSKDPKDPYKPPQVITVGMQGVNRTKIDPIKRDEGNETQDLELQPEAN